MSTTPQSLQAHDTDVHRNHTPSSSYQIRLGSCIEACTACAQACTTCIDDRLSDNMDYQLRGCISADLDCADICSTTARVPTSTSATAAVAVPMPAAPRKRPAANCFTASGDTARGHLDRTSVSSLPAFNCGCWTFTFRRGRPARRSGRDDSLARRGRVRSPTSGRPPESGGALYGQRQHPHLCRCRLRVRPLPALRRARLRNGSRGGRRSPGGRSAASAKGTGAVHRSKPPDLSRGAWLTSKRGRKSSATAAMMQR